MATMQGSLKLLNLNPAGFAMDLWCECGKAGGNMTCSPTSIRTALAMAYEGAAGVTHDEMMRALRIEQGGGAGAPRRATDFSPSRATACELYEANALWAQAGDEFCQVFLDALSKYYGSELRKVDFRRDAPRVLEIINAWVKTNTKGMIPNLLNAQMVTANTSLVLANALYFTGAWQHEFRKENTRQERFINQNGTESLVPTMNQQAWFHHARMPGFQALELPYKDPRYSMLVLLPDSPDDLSGLEARLSVATLTECMARLESREVQVSLPSFKVRNKTMLASALQHMGIRSAFTPRADFTAMSPTGRFYISEVIHEAIVDVFEEGTRAAAATAVCMSVGCCMPVDKPVVFRADHPFLFVIVDWERGELLFMGRVANL